MRRLFAAAFLPATLCACGPSYSPDTYASNAVQQANKVEQGVVVGVRKVGVSAAGTVGTVTGAAAGGIAGSQVAAGPVAAFTALGGSLVGGIAGSAVEHTTADTAAFEYIVRKVNGDLVSVTQKDQTPLALGQNVLVIAGNQARVVPDYTVSPPARGPDTAKTAAPPTQPRPDAAATDTTQAATQPAAARDPSSPNPPAPVAPGQAVPAPTSSADDKPATPAKSQD